MSEWIDWGWSEDKPYPETLDTLVYVETRDGWTDYIEFATPVSVRWWYEVDNYWDNTRNYPDEIIAYRVAD